MTPQDFGTERSPSELGAHEACREVLVAYADCIDAGRASQAIELFCEDAVFEAGPRILRGAARLAPAFASREADRSRRTRHLILNPRFREVGEGAMEVLSLLAVFVVEQDADPAAALAPRALVDCADRMVRGADRRWRIASRRLQLVAGRP